MEFGLHVAQKSHLDRLIRALSWARLVPDVIFAAGAIVLFVFLLRAIWLSFLKKDDLAMTKG